MAAIVHVDETRVKTADRTSRVFDDCNFRCPHRGGFYVPVPIGRRRKRGVVPSRRRVFVVGNKCFSSTTKNTTLQKQNTRNRPRTGPIPEHYTRVPFTLLLAIRVSRVPKPVASWIFKNDLSTGYKRVVPQMNKRP